MAKPVAAVNHEVLIWARKRSGQSVAQVAAALKKEPELIEAWENGTDAPSYPQLEVLAYKIYKRPLALFFFPAPPEEVDPEHSFRTLPAFEIEDLNADTRLKIRHARALQLAVAELTGGTNPAAHQIHRDLHVGPDARPEVVAADVRAYLGINLDTQRQWRTTTQALKVWRAAVEEHGVYVFKNTFRQKDVSGFCLFDAEFPLVYVNNSTAETRQIFTILHELGHLLVATGGVTKRDDSFIETLTGDARRIEVFCNRFAAECLAPMADVRGMLGQDATSDERIAQLASVFKVSRHVILTRLIELRFISQRVYEQKTAEWNAEYDADRGEKPGGNYYLTQAAYLGERYLRLAFGRYYDGAISIEQLADYLNVKVSSVAGLEQAALQNP